MSFIVRPIAETDLQQLFELASQFTLLNLPAQKRILEEKIQRSIDSFFGKKNKKADAEYVFVLEDLEAKRVVGCSLILAKHGSKKIPHYSFQILKKNKFSDALGIGFIHQVLRLNEDTDGPTEIGGLLLDRHYRGRPEKLGRQISLIRFLYMAMYPERFENKILCELAPPLTEDGRSEFWEALGRRFTGLPYAEADALTQKNKEFIKTLFPTEDIYMALLDAKARLVLGRVGTETMPAKHLLESIGFTYTHEVDPFDGGPHFAAQLQDISIVKNAKLLEFSGSQVGSFKQQALVCLDKEKPFRAVMCAAEVKEQKVFLPEPIVQQLQIRMSEKVWVSPLTEREEV